MVCIHQVNSFQLNCRRANKVDSLRAWFNLKYVYVLKSLTMTSKKIDCLSWFGWLFAWKSWPRTESVDFSYSFVDLVLNSLTMKQPWKTLGEALLTGQTAPASIPDCKSSKLTQTFYCLAPDFLSFVLEKMTENLEVSFFLFIFASQYKSANNE